MTLFSKIARTRGTATLCAIFSLSLLTAGTLVTVAGCGGSDSSSVSPGSTRTTPVTFSINWAARTRAISGPGSALSAVAVLKGAATDGSDLVISPAINRDAANLSAYTQNLTSTNVARVGTHPFQVTFYSQGSGGGDIVGVAQASVTIADDGTGIGDINTVGRVASVEVPPNQSVSVDVTKDLTFTAKDGDGKLLAVSPGSAQFRVTGGGEKLQVAPNGSAKGLAIGAAQVTATVDGKTSGAQTVNVSYVGGGTLQGIMVQNNDGSNAAVQAVGGTIPTNGTAPAPNLSGSSTQAVRGGNVLASVQTGSNADALLIGVEGQSDYYRVDVSGASRATSTATGILPCKADCGNVGKKYGAASAHRVGSVTRQASIGGYNVVIILPVDYTGASFTLLIVSESGGVRTTVARLPITINTTAQASGKLQFTLTWGQPVDLDLHVKTPDGDELGFDNRTGSNGGELDLDSNPACSVDNIDNENITWTTTDPQAGTYIIRPNYWSACDNTSPIPYTIRVNKNGVVTTYQGTFTPDEANEDAGTDPKHVITIAVP